jgi:hypothetical protein
MSSSDLVKQIILKFKSEGSDQVKKAAESMSKSFNSKEVDRFVKSMESLNQKFGRAGTGMSTEMKKVTDYFKELNNQQFGKAEKNLDRLGRLINRQIENLDKLKREGASAEMISQRQATLNRSANAFESLASNTPAPPVSGIRNVLTSASGGAGGRFAAGVGALNIAGGILGGISTAAGMYRQYQMQEIQNRVTVADRFKQQAFDVFNGNLERASLYSDPKRAAQIQARSASLNKASDIQMGAATAAGGVGIGAAALGAIGAVTMAPLAIGAAAVAGGYGLYKGYQYWKGGGREAQQVQGTVAAETEAKASTLDTEYYNYAAQRAPQRYEYQRKLQMGDNQALGFRRSMRESGILDEGQMASVANMGMRAASMAKEFGQDVNQTSAMLSQVALSNKGGAKSASDDLSRLFKEAVKSGIEDSALIEEYQKQTAATMDLFKGKMSTGEASEAFNKYLVGTDSRAIDAARNSIATSGRTVSGVSPLMQAKKTAGLLELAGNDYLTYQTLNQLSPSQLNNMSSEQLKSYGITKTNYDKFKTNQVQGTWNSFTAPGAVKEILERSRKGGSMSEGDQDRFLTASGENFASMSQADKAARIQELLASAGETGISLGGTNKPGNLGKVLGGINANTVGIDAGQMVSKAASGQNTIDTKAQEYLEKNMEAILTVFQAQSEQVMKSVDSGEISKSISGIADAADKIRDAMLKAAGTISGEKFDSDVPQSSSNKGGQ